MERTLFVLAALNIALSYGCSMEGVNNWLLPVAVEINDYDRGVIFSRTTSNVLGIVDIQYSEEPKLIGGPYFDIELNNNVFTISTNEDFEKYEEIESSLQISPTIDFTCQGGGRDMITFFITIIDHNNNDPEFLPTNFYDFTVMTPIPPGFLITGCDNNIVVRDIDLTTQRIDYEIEENPYIEIEAVQTEALKEFEAILKTKTLLRSIPEPIEIWIRATDVDLTNDPPRTTTATIRIQADSEFNFPEELIFSQPFYLTTYTKDDELIMNNNIYLSQGYDEEVEFRLDDTQDYASYFVLSHDENQVKISVTVPLPWAAIPSHQINLVVMAYREFTSGATTTVMIHLPEVLAIEFENHHYKGLIEDNNLDMSNLYLSQGYEDNVVVEVLGDYYSAFFTATVQLNVVALSMQPLTDLIIETHAFLTLQVVASSEYSSTFTLVTLEIVKNDKVTPLFEKPLYEGTYDVIAEQLFLEEIILSQGFDETVSIIFNRDEEIATYFDINQDGPSFNIELKYPIPKELLPSYNFIFSLEALKPRTVGAITMISILVKYPEEIVFEYIHYEGIIEDNTLRLPNLSLVKGYENVALSVDIEGDHKSFFSANVEHNLILIDMIPLTQSVIEDNNFIALQILVNNEYSTGLTSLTLDIIKDDYITPVFEKPLYKGTYDNNRLVLERIILTQGFDEQVDITLHTEAYDEYFDLVKNENVIEVIVTDPLPDEIFIQSQIHLIITATKPRTVSAYTVVSVELPTILFEFESTLYRGKIEDKMLEMPDLILKQNSNDNNLRISIQGDDSFMFDYTIENNAIRLSLNSQAENNIRQTELLVLEVTATTDLKSTSTIVVLQVVDDDINTPVFERALYQGFYDIDTGLNLEPIRFTQGYGELDSIKLKFNTDEYEPYFDFDLVDSTISIFTTGPLPENILQQKNLYMTLEVSKDRTVGAATAISILMPIQETVVLRFTQTSYVGTLDDENIQMQQELLLQENYGNLNLNIRGDHKDYFTLTQNENRVNIALTSQLPPDIVEQNQFIVLDVEVSYENAVNGYTIIILEIVKHVEIPKLRPVFDQAYYIGEYNSDNEWTFDSTISLIEGYDETVTLTLRGDDSQWFDLVNIGENVYSIDIIDAEGLQSVEERSYVIFSVVAVNNEDNQGETAVIISLSDTASDIVFRFEQTNYRGTLQSPSTLSIDPILLEGYTNNMEYELVGEYKDYFNVIASNGIFSVNIVSPIPSDVFSDNNVIVLTLNALSGDIRAYTTIILEIVEDENINTVDVLIFEESYYTGTYTINEGLSFENEIKLTAGFDENVEFSIIGDQGQWFDIRESDNAITLELNNEIPSTILASYQQLIFTVIARKPGSTEARAAIIILLPDDTASDIVFRFEQTNYRGTLQSPSTLSIDPILLEGYTNNMEYELVGEYKDYFNVIASNGIFSVNIVSPIPSDVISDNNVIVLTLNAFSGDIRAFTTIILEIVDDENINTVDVLKFEEAYYTGTYTINEGLSFENEIKLTAGFDENLEFSIIGDQGQWFDIQESDNAITLELNNEIPSTILASYQQLIFTVIARKPGSTEARAAIIILLPDDTASDIVFRFEQTNYRGTLQSPSTLSIDPILLEGYTNNIEYELVGEYKDYFDVIASNGIFSVKIVSPIPSDVISDNNVIVLTLNALSGDIRAYTTIILEIVDDENMNSVDVLIFEEAYYTGTYTVNEGLSFENEIKLTAGFDENVEFSIIGAQGQWFNIQESDNAITLELNNQIPSNILASYQQLIFTVIARKPGSTEARAAIIILLPDDTASDIVFRFEQTNYRGTLQSPSTLSIDPILLEGYTNNIEYELVGEYKDYFDVIASNGILSVNIVSPIPSDVISDNNVIVLTLYALSVDIRAYTTIILEIVDDENMNSVDVLIFEEAYYTGTYTVNEGLSFENEIKLTAGFDENVEFSIIGAQGQWFNIQESDNAITLELNNQIPSTILASYQQLIFTIIARKPGSTEARATIIILLPDDTGSDIVFRFEQTNYRGTLQSPSTLSIDPILLEGYTNNMEYELVGEYKDYFNVIASNGIFGVNIVSPIPSDVISDNNVIVLTLNALSGDIRAYTTIILEIVDDENINSVDVLIFEEAYYTGTYTVNEGLSFENEIKLTAGFDENVEFSIIGDQGQWFGIQESDNAITLELNNEIPSTILASYQQLIFTVIARKPGSTEARAAIIILLPDDTASDIVFRFEQTNYRGTLQSPSTLSIDPILLEGYTNNIEYELVGEYKDYFDVIASNGMFSVNIVSPIPSDVISDNNVIVLTLNALSGDIRAYTTIILEIFEDENINSVNVLIFEEAYYTGTYTVNEGLSFENEIKLTAGFDENVEFSIIGDQGQWFGIQESDNAITLELNNEIPSTILASYQQLIFTVIARKPGSTEARATIIILLPDDTASDIVFRFEQTNYRGTLQSPSTLSIDPILLEGYTNNIEYELVGEYKDYFDVIASNGIFSVNIVSPIPTDVTSDNNVIVLTLNALSGDIRAYTTIILEIVDDENINTVDVLIFEEAYYTGTYTINEGLSFDNEIKLTVGFDENVEFSIIGDQGQWFGIQESDNAITLELNNEIPSTILASYQQLIFTVIARKPGSTEARAAIIILLPDDTGSDIVFRFEQTNYRGTLQSPSTLSIDPILLEGYTNNIEYELVGEYKDYFDVIASNGIFSVNIVSPIPSDVISDNNVIVLTLNALSGDIRAYTTIILEIVDDENMNSVDVLIFEEAYYTGTYTVNEGLSFENEIKLTAGFDENVEFSIIGAQGQWFNIQESDNAITLELNNQIPSTILASYQQLIFTIIARKPGSTEARATIIILLPDDTGSDIVFRFEQINYRGTLQSPSTLSIDPILLEGYTNNIEYELVGEYKDYFNVIASNGIFGVNIVSPIPSDVISDNNVIVLTLNALSGDIRAYTTIILEIVDDENINSVDVLIFEEAYYTGTYIVNEGLSFENEIKLTAGFDENVEFSIIGDQGQWFDIQESGNAITLELNNQIPSTILASYQQLIFTVIARKPGSTEARAAIIILLPDDNFTELGVSFEKTLFEGFVQNEVVQHESIMLSQDTDLDVEIFGDYSTLFISSVSNQAVTIQRVESIPMPDDLSHVVLELRISTASAVLVLTVAPEHTDITIPPVVSFSSPTYVIRTDISHTGIIGFVQATADNGESIEYSLKNVNDYLEQRLSVNNNGELQLSAPVNSGVYTFEVVATTIITQTTGDAMVYLTVEAITVCGTDENNNIVVPPLIVLSRDEEEEHRNLIPLEGSEYENCHYNLNNKWPAHQNWLYVDENGMHTRAIDREDPSIASMALSQIQVELTLHCEFDTATRNKRSIDIRPDWLGPYDYGSSDWILTDTIMFNSRRTIVNLIVNDINDNDPVFIGVEDQPLVFGYPIPEIEEVILPRALAELKATDADIGVNAALTYWSNESTIAVSPTTGFVHVRDFGALIDGQLLTVYATDQNGAGRTGSINIIARHLDVTQIAVVTIQDAFLDNEKNILRNLSNSLGYDVKALRSVVITPRILSDEYQENVRIKRDVPESAGTSMQMYVYGLIETVPVEVHTLIDNIMDINLSAVNIISTLPLQDHIDSVQIIVVHEHDTGLLVATILLSILLFILITGLAIWFYLYWRRNKRYKEFNDESSVISQNESVDISLKLDSPTKPRINIEDLKRSERKLQERLQAPLEEVESGTLTPLEAVSSISSGEPSLPIVIQSLDKLKYPDEDYSDEDEFGQKKTTKPVVTFNENVEKIIHVEDNVEVYKL